MIVQDIVSALSLEVFAGADHLSNSITGGYASDLLSCVIITEGRRPDQESRAKAEESGISILLSKENTFTVVSRLVQLGIAGSQ